MTSRPLKSAVFNSLLHIIQAFILCAALPHVFAQENKQVNKPDADQSTLSSVSGRVVYDDTGLPASRHRVQLVSSQLLGPSRPPAPFRIPTAMTNNNGEFVLRRLTPGEYYVVPQPIDDQRSSGSVFPVIGRSGNQDDDKAKVAQFKKDHTRIVVDGQHNITVDVRIPNPHFGTISGRIVDAAGAPSVKANVHLMNKGRNPFGRSVISDEQGQYKFFGLTAGEYFLSASPPVDRPAGAERTNGFEGILGATFFPSTLDSANSPPVTVIADRDTGNIDITLIARSLHKLTGTIHYQNSGQPVSNANLRLIQEPERTTTSRKPDIENAMSNYMSSTDKSGNWSIANVPDGNYRLRVEPSQVARDAAAFVAVEQMIRVEGSDIEKLRIEVGTGSRVSGVVSVEGDATALQFISITASRSKGNAFSHVRLETTGEFNLQSVAPGEVTLSAMVVPQLNFYVKAIEANGVDLLRTNLNINEGEDIKDVRIVVSTGVGIISGRVVSDKDNKPIPGVNVLLRRVNERLRLFGGKLTTITDAEGNYTVSAAPGVYLVLTWRTTDGPDALRAAAEKASKDQGGGITLSANDHKQLDVRLPY